MSEPMPPLPEPAQERRFICNRCGFSGLYGPGHGPRCPYDAVSFGPWWSQEQIASLQTKLEEAEKARDQLLEALRFSYREGWTVQAIEKTAAAIDAAAQQQENTP